MGRPILGVSSHVGAPHTEKSMSPSQHNPPTLERGGWGCAGVREWCGGVWACSTQLAYSCGDYRGSSPGGGSRGPCRAQPQLGGGGIEERGLGRACGRPREGGRSNVWVGGGQHRTPAGCQPKIFAAIWKSTSMSSEATPLATAGAKGSGEDGGSTHTLGGRFVAIKIGKNRKAPPRRNFLQP